MMVILTILCICHFQADPYLRGTILPVRDNIVEDATGSSTKVMELKDALHNLNSLEIKLKV